MSKKSAVRAPGMIQNVFVLLLLAVFACLSTFLVTMGAQLYRNTVDSAEVNNNTRIMTAVVRSAVWAEDGGEVLVERFDDLGLSTLSIVNDFDGDIYYKRLYCKDGYLWESFTSAERPFTGESGEDLCPLGKFEPSIDGKMLTVQLESVDGTADTIRMYLRAGGAKE